MLPTITSINHELPNRKHSLVSRSSPLHRQTCTHIRARKHTCACARAHKHTYISHAAKPVPCLPQPVLMSAVSCLQEQKSKGLEEHYQCSLPVM